MAAQSFCGSSVSNLHGKGGRGGGGVMPKEGGPYATTPYTASTTWNSGCWMAAGTVMGTAAATWRMLGLWI